MKFIGADLNGANLTNANIEGTDFRLSNFVDISGDHAIYNAATKFPLGFSSSGTSGGNVAGDDNLEKFTRRTIGGAVPSGMVVSDIVKGNFTFNSANNSKRAAAGRIADLQTIIQGDEFSDDVNKILKNRARFISYWNGGSNVYTLTSSHDLSKNAFSAPGGNPIDLSGANFTGSSLIESSFYGAVLQGVIFNNCDMSATQFSDAAGQETNLSKSRWIEIDLSDNKGIRPEACPDPTAGTVYFPKNMKGIYAKDVSFNGVIFPDKTDLSGSDLSGSRFTGAVMREVNLTDADLSGTDLSGCSCNNANFTRAKMHGTDITNAAFGDIIAIDASMVNLDFASA